MCQYSARDPGVELAGLCAVHGAGLRDGSLTAFSFENGVGVGGEVDRSNQETLSSLLSGATGAAQHDHFVVDLAGVDLLDVGGARALVTATAAYRELGGRVRLSGARPHVDQVIRLLRVERSPGLQNEAV
jgi:anti-anti-sigma factor